MNPARSNPYSTRIRDSWSPSKDIGIRIEKKPIGLLLALAVIF